MSPTESDLRAALHDGEGDDAPDVDQVIALARAHRSQRRVRVLSAAAAVVVVATAAIGGAVLWGGSDDNDRQATGASPSAQAIASAPPAAVPHDSLRPAPASTAGSGSTDDASCPASYPGRSVPVQGAPPAAASGPMFGSPVVRVVICDYSSTGTASGVATAPLTVTGSDAAALVDSIESASTGRLKVVCPDIVSAQKRQLAIIGITAGGTRLPAVTTDVSIPNCNQPITNGTAVRYAWKPPAALAVRIAGLTQVQPVSGAGGMNGSPVR